MIHSGSGELNARTCFVGLGKSTLAVLCIQSLRLWVLDNCISETLAPTAKFHSKSLKIRRLIKFAASAASLMIKEPATITLEQAYSQKTRRYERNINTCLSQWAGNERRVLRKNVHTLGSKS